MNSEASDERLHFLSTCYSVVTLADFLKVQKFNRTKPRYSKGINGHVYGASRSRPTSGLSCIESRRLSFPKLSFFLKKGQKSWTMFQCSKHNSYISLYMVVNIIEPIIVYIN